MFSLTITFGPGPTAWGLLFKTEESANAAFSQTAFGPGNIDISDDFGQRATIAREAINGAMLEDMTQSQLGTIERSMHEARTRAKVQGRAMNDPELRTTMQARGPAIHTPSGMA